jgi:hypothetical protein
MESGLPRKRSTSAHDWSHVLTFEGKSCLVFEAFTRNQLFVRKKRRFEGESTEI